MLGVSRQVYSRSRWSRKKQQDKAQQVVCMVASIRKDMPRIGFRKLYYLLYEPLKEIKVGRDKFLSILKANHLLIKPARSYRITTNSHLRFRKHKNLIENNSKRPHWSCYMKTPNEMHEQKLIEIRIYKNKDSSRASPGTIS